MTMFSNQTQTINELALHKGNLFSHYLLGASLGASMVTRTSETDLRCRINVLILLKSIMYY